MRLLVTGKITSSNSARSWSRFAKLNFLRRFNEELDAKRLMDVDDSGPWREVHSSSVYFLKNASLGHL